MMLAIRGDQSTCMTMRAGPHTWLLAVARGFGRIQGVPVERALLERLRAECEQRMRRARFRRAIDRRQTAATALMAVLARVNAELRARTANHDDCVTASASLTAALIVRARAYVLHAGTTAAYLAHRGEVVALSCDDGFDCAPVLARSLIASPELEIGVSSADLEEGDSIVLVDRRIPGQVDRQALIAHVESAGTAEHVLVARFEPGDACGAEPAGDGGANGRARMMRLARRVAATLAAILSRTRRH